MKIKKMHDSICICIYMYVYVCIYACLCMYMCVLCDTYIYVHMVRHNDIVIHACHGEARPTFE